MRRLGVGVWWQRGMLCTTRLLILRHRSRSPLFWSRFRLLGPLPRSLHTRRHRPGRVRFRCGQRPGYGRSALLVAWCDEQHRWCYDQAPHGTIFKTPQIPRNIAVRGCCLVQVCSCPPRDVSLSVEHRSDTPDPTVLVVQLLMSSAAAIVVVEIAILTTAAFVCSWLCADWRGDSCRPCFPGSEPPRGVRRDSIKSSW